ncbi:MAG TPA: OmpH family outer membrane protein [Candidatus Acidoferrales bacterium]|jgi:outer membrane protein|nr:OmpH family outer membrane protein [Candidatus Acidoferrales bacterium]
MSFRTGLRPLLACCALLAISQAAPAQTKVAVINLQRAVLESAEIKAASDAMSAKYKPRVAEIEQLNKEISALASNLQSNAGKLTEQAQTDMNQQAQRKQRDVQRKQDDLQADVDRERNEILQRSSVKMSAVVKKLAEAKGLDIVVDAPYAVYFKEALEITAEAIAAYDKENPAAAAGKAK